MLVRFAVLAPALVQPIQDPDNYLPLARSVADGQGLRFRERLTAYRPPLYPLVLAPLVAAFGLGQRLNSAVAALHLALGGWTVALTASSARRLGVSTFAARLAAVLVAFDPVLIVQSRSVMTETLAAALLAAALCAASRNTNPGNALAGLAYGLLGLCRPSMLAAWALTSLAAFIASPKVAWRVRITRVSLLTLPAIAVLAPWALRNAQLFHEPVWTTTHAGYTLYLANNPVYYTAVVDGPPNSVWSGPEQRAWFRKINGDAQGLPEPEADRFFRQEALRFISEHPHAFLRATWQRILRFWGIAPAEAVYSLPLRILTAIWTVPFWLLVVRGSFRRTSWTWPNVAAPAAVIALTLVHSIYWTDLRMRAPLVPALALLAANACARAKNAVQEQAPPAS
jgi:4-amino-4-deoxy-L-arabinose transferase-like glycosyltransferase